MKQARHIMNLWIVADNKAGDNGRVLPVERKDIIEW